ncbi:HAD-like domain-containing protein [Ochromonadaceae sp. CCMP2298]|nr:HAD-like domain-containing protein [Ochromonadaceae sp. CCMP2298]
MWNLEVQGKTAVCVAVGGAVVAVLGIADTPKAEAHSTIKALLAMGLDVWMITGDNRTTAEALADELDLSKDRVLAGVLPADKARKVRELQDIMGRRVAMVGDGINDSPALVEAHLGVAIGAGTEVAIEAADFVLIRSNLHDLVVALDLAKVVFSRIQYNFAWALVYNLLAVPYAAGVWYPWTHLLLPPQYAGLAMAFSSVSVVLSSMALWLYRRPVLTEGEESSGGGAGVMGAVGLAMLPLRPPSTTYSPLFGADSDVDGTDVDGTAQV